MSRSRERLRAWRIGADERRFHKETRKVWQSFERLGIRPEEFPCTEHAQRKLSATWLHLLTWGIGLSVAGMAIMVVAMPILALVAWNLGHHYDFDSVERAAAFAYQQWDKALDETAAGRNPLFAELVQFAPLGTGVGVLILTVRKGAIRKFWLTQRTGAAIVRCAEAKAVVEIDRLDQVRRVDSLCRAVEWSIWRSHLWRGGMTRRSPRRAHARQHAALVIAALHRAQERLDERPDDAVLEALATMLATIGERHAAGRVGALLPSEMLDGVTAVSLRRQAFRESLVIARGVVAALLAVFVLDRLLPHLGVRDEVSGYFLAGGALIAAVLAAGWRPVREFLSNFPGP